MKQRCLNPKNASYPRYGGRGIGVCDRWLTFEGFLADMGTRPAGMTLDRIEGDGDYGPGNCRWAGKTLQTANRRPSWGTATGRQPLLERETCRRGHVLAEVGVYTKGQPAPTCKGCAKRSRVRYLRKVAAAA